MGRKKRPPADEGGGGPEAAGIFDAGRTGRERATQMVTLRITATQSEVLDAVADWLGRGTTRADVLRAALAYWISHGPHAASLADVLARLKGMGGGR